MTTRFPSLATTSALVLALILLVAGAARDTPFRSFLQGARANRWYILLDLTPVLLLGAVVALTLTPVLQRRREEGRPAVPPRQALTRSVLLAAVGVTLVSLWLIARTDFPPSANAGPGSPVLVELPGRLPTPWSMSNWFDMGVLAGEGTGEGDLAGEPGSGMGDRLPILTIGMGFLAVLLAAAIYARWMRRRMAATDEPDDEVEDPRRDAARAALDETIRAMLLDPDPNTAIRGAYAHLLAGLDPLGGGRLDHEGPMEHLRRVLTTLRVPSAPLTELTHLFELARFSPHILTAAHRERALAALRAVAAGLEGGMAMRPVPAGPPAATPSIREDAS